MQKIFSKKAIPAISVYLGWIGPMYCRVNPFGGNLERPQIDKSLYMSLVNCNSHQLDELWFQMNIANSKNIFVNRSVDLSIVIITRNEAKNIARAIESVLHSELNSLQIEILLVDSASTDETVEIAKRFPVNIVRIPSTWFRSVSAGRLIGMHYTSGELVLHMDGDMELDPKWVERSMSYMLEHPDVGAVGGYWRNVYMKDGQIIGEDDEYRDPQNRISEVRYVGGAALYRRSAIEKMGGFQPFIRGEEGVYLSMGIRYVGYKVVRLPYLMSRHYCIPRQSLAGSWRKLRLGFVLGYGQVLRSYLGTGLFWMYLKERCVYSSFYLTSVLVSFIMLVIALYSKNIIFFGSWMLVVAVAILAFAIKKRSIRKALLSCLIQTWVAYGTVRGFFMSTKSSAEYPTKAEIVQVCYPLGGVAQMNHQLRHNFQVCGLRQRNL